MNVFAERSDLSSRCHFCIVSDNANRDSEAVERLTNTKEGISSGKTGPGELGDLDGNVITPLLHEVDWFGNVFTCC